MEHYKDCKCWCHPEVERLGPNFWRIRRLNDGRILIHVRLGGVEYGQILTANEFFGQLAIPAVSNRQ